MALVGQRVEVAALDVSEAGLLLAARCRVARLVSAPLSQTVLPSVLWAAGQKEEKREVKVSLK